MAGAIAAHPRSGAVARDQRATLERCGPRAEQVVDAHCAPAAAREARVK